MDRKTVKVGQDFSFVYDKVHYSMPRKYLRKTLKICAETDKIHVCNEHGDLIRPHDRSYTPKSWAVVPSDMPKEYENYGYWNKPYFLAKAERIGPNTKIMIQNIMEKSDYPVQSFRSYYGILRFAEKYSISALEECYREAILYGKCSYTCIASTISMYAEPAPTLADRLKSSLKPLKPYDEDTSVTGIYKDDDDKYSLQNLLNRKKEGEQE